MEARVRPTKGAERVNSCVVVLSSSLFRRRLFPSPLPLVHPDPRFKYQRRLKSDLYHAESCYLYRLIRDLPACYAEGGSSYRTVLTEALTSSRTKACVGGEGERIGSGR